MFIRVRFIVSLQISDIFNYLRSFSCSIFLFSSFIVPALKSLAYSNYLFYWVFVLQSQAPQNYYFLHCYCAMIDAFLQALGCDTVMLIFPRFYYAAERWVFKSPVRGFYRLINFNITDLIMSNEVSSLDSVSFIYTEQLLSLSVLVNYQVAISIDLFILVWISNHCFLGFCFCWADPTALFLYSLKLAYSIIIQLLHPHPYVLLYLIVYRLKIYVICLNLLQNLIMLPYRSLMLCTFGIVFRTIYSFMSTLNLVLIFDPTVKINIYYRMLFLMMMIFLVKVGCFFGSSILFIHLSHWLYPDSYILIVTAFLDAS